MERQSQTKSIGSPETSSLFPLTEVTNSPTGSPPSDFSGYLWNTIVSVADFIWRGIVAVASFMIKLAIALGEICLKFVKFLVQSAVIFIEAAVDAIVDAFMAFVEWVIKFIIDTITTVFGPIIQVLQKMANAYSNGIEAALGAAQMDVSRTGDVSGLSYSRFSSALYGDLFWLVFGVGALMGMILLMLMPLIGAFGFLLGFVIDGIVSVLALNAFGLSGSDIQSGKGVEEQNMDSLPDDSGYSSICGWYEVTTKQKADEAASSRNLLKAVGVLFRLLSTSYGLAAAKYDKSGITAMGLTAVSMLLSFISLASNSLGMTAFSVIFAAGIFMVSFAITDISIWNKAIAVGCSGVALGCSLLSLLLVTIE